MFNQLDTAFLYLRCLKSEFQIKQKSQPGWPIVPESTGKRPGKDRYFSKMK